MLKTTVLSQVLVADEVLAADEVGGVEGGNESIEKCGKLSKTGKSSKSNEKLSKFKKPPALEHAFTLSFVDMRIETKAAYFLGK